jgi:AAA domain
MTQHKPTIWVQRLVVVKNGTAVFDEAFHLGVNVIRGENSTGKSTIADLIFFALGGDLTKWKDESGACDSVYAQVSIDSLSITLRRDIENAGQQPMWIFIGDFSVASASASEGWQKYPYRRYGDKESFTQVLFRILDMPEVPGDAGANITMHQLLRLMYVDQMTPVDRIFRFEQNDSANRRQAVGDLMCGILDSRIYTAQLSLRELEKQFEVAERQLSGLYRVIDRVENSPTVGLIEASTRNLNQERVELLAKVEALKNRRFEAPTGARQGERIIAELKARLDKVNRDIATFQLDVGQTELAVEDAAMLIAEVTRNLKQIRDGQAATDILGPIAFSFCPSCYSPISDSNDEHVCSLCKSPLDPKAEKMRFVRMRNELELQMKESEKLQGERREKLTKARNMLRGLASVRDQLTSEYLSLVRNYVSDADIEIEQLSTRLGYLNRELVDLERQRRLAEQLEVLSAEKARLNAEISATRDQVKAWLAAKERRESAAYALIHRKTAEILGMDLPSEQEFTSETAVYFNFAEDRIAIAGKSGFSASSLTVIRNAFHLALLWASVLDKDFKYPRFLLMDNVEDKGMTQARSQNFQQKIVEISASLPAEHQIIFTTSMVSPDLDGSDLVVGDHYRFDHKSLRFTEYARVTHG